MGGRSRLGPLGLDSILDHVRLKELFASPEVLGSYLGPMFAVERIKVSKLWRFVKQIGDEI